jgi:hypothetical protein
MSPEGRERVNWLCKHIQEEKDQQTFNDLVSELSKLLEINGYLLSERPEKREPKPS